MLRLSKDAIALLVSLSREVLVVLERLAARKGRTVVDGSAAGAAVEGAVPYEYL